MNAFHTANAARDIDALQAWMCRHPRLFVLTGAGCSTASGIPDYRDEAGDWKRRPPVTYADFIRDAATRQRYWARSFAGWPHFSGARPNAAHMALAALEASGRTTMLLTQNVDGLHQRAGSRSVVDLHGRLDTVRCLACGRRTSREDMQTRLAEANPAGSLPVAAFAPDGDADLEHQDITTFVVPDCMACGGLLKPDVVFFGENVPRARVETAMNALAASDALLVVGSSLMVYSGYRFARTAHELGHPIALLTRGTTRADALAALHVWADCVQALPEVIARL